MLNAINPQLPITPSTPARINPTLGFTQAMGAARDGASLPPVFAAQLASPAPVAQRAPTPSERNIAAKPALNREANPPSHWEQPVSPPTPTPVQPLARAAQKSADAVAQRAAEKPPEKPADKGADPAYSQPGGRTTPANGAKPGQTARPTNTSSPRQAAKIGGPGHAGFEEDVQARGTGTAPGSRRAGALATEGDALAAAQAQAQPQAQLAALAMSDTATAGGNPSTAAPGSLAPGVDAASVAGAAVQAGLTLADNNGKPGDAQGSAQVALDEGVSTRLRPDGVQTLRPGAEDKGTGAGGVAPGSSSNAMTNAMTNATTSNPLSSTLSAAQAGSSYAAVAAGMLGTTPSALASGTSTTPTATAQANVPAQPGTPLFALQTSQQISLFAAGGVETAQLHLNPAHMGPVSVQIQLEGTLAQVHLASENAATRQALEQALPQLASELRDNGLTLAGGGVFEHARQDEQRAGGQEANQQGAGAASQGRNAHNGKGNVDGGAGAESASSATGGAATRRTRSVVDLIA
jgi:flagellar hook-length control protein FliK